MDYSYNYNYGVDSVNSGILAGIGAGTLIFALIVCVFMLVVMWIIYKKAGEPGWAAIVPVYNYVVLFRIIKMEWWHILIMFFVPFAAIVYSIIIPIKLSKVFGKSTGFGIFALFFSIIAYPILAFGSAKYEG